jgi:hypothetical protein
MGMTGPRGLRQPAKDLIQVVIFTFSTLNERSSQLDPSAVADRADSKLEARLTVYVSVMRNSRDMNILILHVLQQVRLVPRIQLRGLRFCHGWRCLSEEEE